jgi:hypothetical protein
MSFVKESINDLDLDKQEKISYHEQEASFHFEQAMKHRHESECHSNKFFQHQLEILKLRGHHV